MPPRSTRTARARSAGRCIDSSCIAVDVSSINQGSQTANRKTMVTNSS